jgi:hypothetical protein
MFQNIPAGFWCAVHTTSRPTQAPVRYVLGLSVAYSGKSVVLTTPPPSSAGLRMGRSCTSASPLYLHRNVTD